MVKKNHPNKNPNKSSHHTKNFLTKKKISTNPLDDIPDLAGKIVYMMKKVKSLQTESGQASSSSSSLSTHHHTNAHNDNEISDHLQKLISSLIILSKLRSDMLKVAAHEAHVKKSEGFDLESFGGSLAKIGYVGLPSVGKSSLLKKLAPSVGGGRDNAVEGRIGSYAFTTMTAVPGVVQYRGANLEMIDLPGLIEGAGLYRQRHILTAVRRVDMICMLIDATESSSDQINLLEKELDNAHIRINSQPDFVKYTPRKSGGICLTTQTPLSRITLPALRHICKQYKIHHAEFLFYKDATYQHIIDIIEGNRVYLPCRFVYTMIDLVSLDHVDALVKADPKLNWAISVHKDMGIKRLLDMFWDTVGFFRVFVKKRGEKPDFENPLFLIRGSTVQDFVYTVDKASLPFVKFCYVWGVSVKQYPSPVGLKHKLLDDDVIQIMTS